MANDYDADARLRDLEWRLAEYHEHLESSLEHDRNFQLNATWGIVTAVSGTFCVIAAMWLLGKLGLSGWVESVVTGIALIVAWVAGAAWSERGREGDVKKLSRLPKWRRGER